MDTQGRWMLGGAVVGATVSLCRHLLFRQGTVSYGVDTAIIGGAALGAFFGGVLRLIPAKDRLRVIIVAICWVACCVFVRQVIDSVWQIDYSAPPHFIVRFIRWVLPFVLTFFLYDLLLRAKIRRNSSSLN